VRELLAADADILCLQEVNHFHELEASLATHGFAGAFQEKRNSPCVGLGAPADGLALFWRTSRLTLQGPPQGVFFTDSRGEALSQCALLAHFQECEGRPLLVATTHLKAKAGEECAAIRLAEARQLRALLEARSAPGAAVLCCGDFNTVLDSDPLRALLGMDAPSSLRLSAVVCPPAVDGAAYTTFKVREAGVKEAAIDHVLAAALRPVAAWAAPTRAAAGPDALPSNAFPSDHVPQVVDFSFD